MRIATRGRDASVGSARRDRTRAADVRSFGAAHGIAGNRFFVGTLTLDDPAVADEAVLPNFPRSTSRLKEAMPSITGSFVRLLTPTLQVSIDSGWINQSWPTVRTSGFDTTDIGIKGEIFRNNEHEALVSGGVAWGIGHSAAAEVGADEPNSIQPGLFFGKGFGDLPDWLAWARPFAITGAIVDEQPIGTTSNALAPT